jgi:hypothetical protein
MAVISRGAVMAVTVTTEVISVPALVMNCLAPSITHSEPSSRARVRVLPASEPAPGGRLVLTYEVGSRAKGPPKSVVSALGRGAVRGSARRACQFGADHTVVTRQSQATASTYCALPCDDTTLLRQLRLDQPRVIAEEIVLSSEHGNVQSI